MESVVVETTENHSHVAPWERFGDGSAKFSPARFSWVKKQPNGSLRAITKSLACRDHMLDILEIHYNFAATYEVGAWSIPSSQLKQGLDTDATRILITFLEEEMAEAFEKNFLFLQAQEFTYFKNVAPSKLFSVSSPTIQETGEKKVFMYLVEGDPIWQKAHCLNSFYTLAIRLTPAVDSIEQTFEQILRNGVKVQKRLHNTDLTYLNDVMSRHPFSKLLPAMETLDFGKAESPSGLVLDVLKYGHGRGGLVWTTAETLGSFKGRSVFADQLKEKLK